ncbi:DUF3397 family protein [Weissella soli]|uniref:Uncharacterized protein DUF3397 n=1 Tax=Weissella soli TaxID=155866 RepID=A0A288Q9Q9_9LACO|nr:DUF3397 family protein [Weissella soli]AOT56650.1 hypothetical protein WSWS_01019 [Weissella soli]NKY83104.1 DUF3397 family protein [Weissella soli]RDL12213.1 uncharacterized protein DUF3397 [Weissella soli]GEN92541.1 hypothetical protein WSO01_01530 [Weissella soli]
MLTFVEWPYILAITLAVGVVIFALWHRITRIPGMRGVQPLDVMVLVLWWSMSALAFQTWMHAGIVNLWIMFFLWGMALILLQAFIGGHFEVRRFLKSWWIIIKWATVLAYLVVVILVLVINK